jgi:NADPH2:quinone reductase
MELPRPEVRAGHVLIRVQASSVNPIDTKLRRGAVKLNPPFPAILQGDVAGVIEQVGEGVAEFRPGDEVYGCAGGLDGMQGALAEFMLADANLLAPKPRSLSFADAATLPLVAITCWEALIDRANLQADSNVLIQGGTGGVGQFAVQLAKWRGAKVFATCGSEEKMKIARSLGADEAINYKTTPVKQYVEALTGGAGFDLVYDTAGGQALLDSIEAARMRGAVAIINGRTSLDVGPAFSKGLTLYFILMLLPLLTGQGRPAHGRILREVARLVDGGSIRPLIDERRFPFAQAGEAHRLLESREAIGKISMTLD